MAQTTPVTSANTHAPSCHGRGCPACTGLTWAELQDREADRAFLDREAAASRDDHEHDWQTR